MMCGYETTGRLFSFILSSSPSLASDLQVHSLYRFFLPFVFDEKIKDDRLFQKRPFFFLKNILSTHLVGCPSEVVCELCSCSTQFSLPSLHSRLPASPASALFFTIRHENHYQPSVGHKIQKRKRLTRENPSPEPSRAVELLFIDFLNSSKTLLTSQFRGYCYLRGQTNLVPILSSMGEESGYTGFLWHSTVEWMIH